MLIFVHICKLDFQNRCYKPTFSVCKTKNSPNTKLLLEAHTQINSTQYTENKGGYTKDNTY